MIGWIRKLLLKFYTTDMSITESEKRAIAAMINAETEPARRALREADARMEMLQAYADATLRSETSDHSDYPLGRTTVDGPSASGVVSPH